MCSPKFEGEAGLFGVNSANPKSDEAEFGTDSIYDAYD
jgi:hypothetical protein